MKGPKKEKVKTKTKLNQRKTQSRKAQSGSSYLGNYDSRKELQKKINLSNASGKRSKKGKRDKISKGEGVSQDSEVLVNTGSDFTKDLVPGKSTFFKKKGNQIYVQPMNPSIGIYGDVGRVSPFKGQNKHISLSKTDDLKFLKDMGRNKLSNSRRGSSAFIEENKRHVQSTHNSNKVKVELKNTHASHQYQKRHEEEIITRNEREGEGERNIVKISRSLVIGKNERKEKRKEKEDGNLSSSRDAKDQIEYLKKKYFGKDSKVVSIRGSLEKSSLLIQKKKEKTPTWKFIKNSTKNLKNTNQGTSKGKSQSNERSKSIEQNPTYLKNLGSDSQNPKGKAEKLAQSNNPAIGVGDFTQSKAHKRNKLDYL